MKIYLIVDDDSHWIASAHFDKDEADDRVKGLRSRSVKEIEVEGDLKLWMVMDTAITNIYFISFDEREARAFHKVNGFIFSEVIEWPVPYRHYNHEQYRLPTQEEIDAIDLDAKDEEE